jgi:prophage maintenance system killer protein
MRFAQLSTVASRPSMEAFLMLNGSEIVAVVDEQERLMLDLAAGLVTREQLAEWLAKHLQSPRS